MICAMRARPLAALAAAATMIAGAALTTSAPAQAFVTPVPPSTAWSSFPMPTYAMAPSTQPIPLAEASKPLPVSYTFNGTTATVDDYLARSLTQGLVVLDGQSSLGPAIAHERYYSADEDTLFQTWSMAKSFTSAAVGIALGEGAIDSIDEPITAYLGELKGTGYDGVSIRDVLAMSSGIQWNEGYNAPDMHFRASGGTSVKQIAQEQVRGWVPGSRMNYTSMNSFVLAWLVSAATGVPYQEYVAEKIWGPAGMASAGHIGTDFHDAGLGYCCYYATDRDFARFGLLFLRNGVANGQQVVPASWVAESTSPSVLQPGPDSLGYGLHWWVGSQGDYMATGLGAQHIYVSPQYGVVVAHSSFGTGPVTDNEALAAFRAVAKYVADHRGTP